MYEKNTVEERCRKILEENGGVIADKSRTILLEDIALKDLRPPLEFISKSWRDPLTPAMMSLSCEAVGGRPTATNDAALALSLMNLSFYVWDDVIDKAALKSLKPTLFGKFGEGTALIIGGLASAKAFSILNEMNIDKEKRQTITRMFWNLWTKMAQAEAGSLRLRSQKNLSSEKKFWKLKMEATADPETCMKIGAFMGNGFDNEVKILGAYGQCLGLILELWKDFLVSINLTLELAEKIKTGALPYCLLWARERSEKIRKQLDFMDTNALRPSDIKEIVKNILETKAIEHVLKTVKDLAKNAETELSKLKKNRATRTLKLFMKAQPEIFNERLSLFHS